LFCLAGAWAIFQGDQLTVSCRRLIQGGLAFGLAGAIKAWAILPVIVVVGLCWPLCGRRRAALYLGGVCAGFALVVVPFVAPAPPASFHDVIGAQLSRGDVTRVPVLTRAIGMTGIRDLSSDPAVALLAGLAIGTFVIVCTTAASVRSRHPPPPLEAFA